MARHYIEYYADDGSMGDTSTADCDAYREWAEGQLRAAYPRHDISVHAEPSLRTSLTDDTENETEINEFCARLWDSCPWNGDFFC